MSGLEIQESELEKTNEKQGSLAAESDIQDSNVKLKPEAEMEPRRATQILKEIHEEKLMEEAD